MALAPPVLEPSVAAALDGPEPTLPEADRPAGWIIEVELPSGMKLRLTGAVDAAALTICGQRSRLRFEARDRFRS